MKIDCTLEKIKETTCAFLQDNPKIANIYDVTLPCGQEHYLLLASITSQIKNMKILELGTHNGRSTLALNYGNLKCGNNNKIYTYDIMNFLLPNVFENTDIEFRMDNLFDHATRENNRDHILSSDLIFIDVDPHEGLVEYDMYLWLKHNNYKGLLLFDDIHLGPGHLGVTSGNSMQMFWDKIEDKYKIDVTNVGHNSGSGFVSFNFNEHVITKD